MVNALVGYGLWMSIHGLRLIPNYVIWMYFGHPIYPSIPSPAPADLVQTFAAALVAGASPASEAGSPAPPDEAVAALAKIFAAALKAAAPAPAAPLKKKNPRRCKRNPNRISKSNEALQRKIFLRSSQVDEEAPRDPSPSDGAGRPVTGKRCNRCHYHDDEHESAPRGFKQPRNPRRDHHEATSDTRKS
ncbi:hypothetical protein DAPPUDRAFT_105245 [Daphnia pulex]|uniref:Uncharacterized protein n=1 Tax=Daphnia pulex TaxID=6669 RepID=E9GPV9_DAPPU|nr:hypothetical protein DAPPUDRAFT_105245 [Daphnia pulex]|eukprot:EFX78518.1 hypothetical protein DAPPUDRAFT_105245 [Daphnia pulex]